MKNILLICSIILLGNQANSQVITGAVFEQGAGKNLIPLIGANVHLVGYQKATSTDLNGKFKLDVHEISYPVKMVSSFVGYYSDTIELKKIPEYNFKIILEKSILLNEVKIVDERSSTIISTINPVNTQLITQKELTKAACCNLSESFQTNASIDASYSDAVSGTKQIKLLGLDGIYSQITLENLPFLRGLSNSNGLSMIPGTWIDQIAVSKGSGSVVNGFESMTGQINIEIQEPSASDLLYINLYGSDEGRLEANVHSGLTLSDKVQTNILVHSSMNNSKIDHNKDGFLDSPLTTRNSFMNRWHFDNLHNREGQLMIRYYGDERNAGQNAFKFNTLPELQNAYGIGIKNEMFDVIGKLGFLFPHSVGKSIGNMFLYRHHNYESFFGLNQYNATQQMLYYNFIYDNLIRDTRHKFRTGVSLQADLYKENYNDSISNYDIIYPGAYFEYTYSNLDNFTFIAGLRGDYRIGDDFYSSPRIHIKYDIKPETNLRLSGGRGFRNPNIFAESSGILSSSRIIRFIEKPKTEVSWNTGVSLVHNTRFLGKKAYISADYFYTSYENQIIKDIETFGELNIYNLNGKSYSHAMQVEGEFKPLKTVTAKLAYKKYLVRSTFNQIEKEQPLVSPDRFLVVVDYASLNEKWELNVTYNGFSPARIPEVPAAYNLHQAEYYSLFNSQLTYKIKNLDLYGGVENIFDYTIGHPIIDAENPFGSNFDASLIWGPVMGRVIYGGIRFKIENKKQSI